MGNQATPVQAPAREHCIRASAVKAVLSARNERRGRPTLVCVALTAHAYAGDCGRSWRDAWSYRRYLGLEPVSLRSGISWSCGVELIRVAEKVRTARGLAEVKKTWGLGYRALMASLNQQRGS